jgi:YesN/AraC family two-component response regulator
LKALTTLTTGEGVSMVRKVLIVDDEPMIREIFKEIFSMESFDVIEAQNGREAFGKIKQQHFDCVVSDVRMPGGDGFELAMNIRSHTGHKPKIFFVSGFSDVTIEKAKEANVIKIFAKPFDFFEIVREIISTLN